LIKYRNDLYQKKKQIDIFNENFILLSRKKTNKGKKVTKLFSIKQNTPKILPKKKIN